MAFKKWKHLLVALVVIVILFVAVSIFDIVLAVISARFYSNAAFYVLFGVGGMFAAFLSYSYGADASPAKNEFTRWSLISLLFIVGLFFFFWLSRFEGGEYEIPFKAFGATLALTTILFMKGKVGF